MSSIPGTLMKAMAQTEKKFPSVVFRAGTDQGPSFDLKKEIDEVWLVTDPKLYFPLNQDISHSIRGQRGKSLENVCLWKTDIAHLRKYFTLEKRFDGVCQVELKNSTSVNKKEEKEEIQRCLESLEWQTTTVPKCKGGLSLMDLSALVQAVIVYMKDHYPTTPEELNFHAELKAASQWCWSDDYNQLVMKKVPVDDCRLKIAVIETLKTWEKEEKDLQRRKADESDKDSDVSDESVIEQLSDVREAIDVLKKYIGSGASTMSSWNKLPKRKVSEPKREMRSDQAALKRRKREHTFQTLGKRSPRLIQSTVDAMV